MPPSHNSVTKVKYLSPPQDTPLWHSQTHRNALLPLNSFWGKSGLAGPSSRDQGFWVPGKPQGPHY